MKIIKINFMSIKQKNKLFKGIKKIYKILINCQINLRNVNKVKEQKKFNLLNLK